MKAPTVVELWRIGYTDCMELVGDKKFYKHSKK